MSLSAPFALVLTVALGAAPTEAPAPQPPDTTVFEIGGVEVSAATRLQGEGPARALAVLDRAMLESLPVRSVAEAIGWATGVDLQPRSGAQADVAVRGGTSEQVLVLVDGVPVSDAQTGHFHLDLAVPLAAVERIEVLRGAGSAVHGAGALGGVIHIVTRPESRALTATVEVEGGSFRGLAGGGRVGGRIGAWSVAGSLRLDRSDGHREGTDHAVALGHLAASGRVGGGLASLRVGWAARDFGADGFYAPYPSYEETRTRTAALRWSRPLAGRTLEVAAHLRAHDDDFVLQRSDPTFYRNLHSTLQSGVDLTLRSAPDRWVWAVGASGGRDVLESATLGDRQAARGALFGEVGWRGTEVRIQGGLRLDAHDHFAPSWSPSLTAAWDAGRSLRLRAALSRAFRTPTWTDRFYEDPANRGNPDLAVERAWSGEVGVDWTPAGAVHLRTTFFLREARDLIDYARPLDEAEGEAVVWQSRNVASATFRGVEIEVAGLRVGPAAVASSVELLDLSARAAGPYLSKYALRPLTRSARLAVQLPLGDRVTTGVHLTHRRRKGEAARTVADLRVDFRLGDARLWIASTNLHDVAGVDVSGMPMPGRAIRTGVSVAMGGR